MQDDGQLVFGTWTGQTNTITSPASYNDGQWHHVVATQSGDRDEAVRRRRARRHQPADRRPRTTPATGRSAATSRGARRATTSNGTIDEVAVYLSELSAARVAAHYAAAAPAANQPPTADFTSTTSGLTADFTSTSTDADGTIACYAWDFGDGGTEHARRIRRTPMRRPAPTRDADRHRRRRRHRRRHQAGDGGGGEPGADGELHVDDQRVDGGLHVDVHGRRRDDRLVRMELR